MIVAMQERASEEQIQAVIERLVELGFEVHRSTGLRCLPSSRSRLKFCMLRAPTW